MKGLFDSSGKKFKSSNPELIPKAVTQSLTSHLKDDVKKAVNETIIFHIDNNSGQSNVQNKNLDLYPIMNDDTESEVTYLKQIEGKKSSPSILSGLACDGNVKGVRRFGKKSIL